MERKLLGRRRSTGATEPYLPRSEKTLTVLSCRRVSVFLDLVGQFLTYHPRSFSILHALLFTTTFWSPIDDTTPS